ncbi:MAG: helix-turn-helix domain-containing protein [Eubacteriales bacterium]|nr:helix-turn-helix domain-containing protein [Eubacteriales bacterium]
MKLNSVMLFHRLENYFDIEYERSSQNLYVRRPVFYNDFFQFDHQVVIVDARDIRHCVDRCESCILICLGQPEEDVRDAGENDLAVLNDPTSGGIILNILTNIFELFDEWDSRLNRIFYQTMDVQEMLEATAQVLSPTISLLDRDFRYIAYTSTPDLSRKFVDETNRLPVKDVALLTSRPDFKELETLEGPFSYTAGESVVYQNIFDDGRYVGRLCALPDNPSEEEYTKAVFRHLTPYIERLYGQQQTFEAIPVRKAALRRLLLRCFNGEAPDTAALLSALPENGYRQGASLCVLCLQSVSERFSHSMNYLCAQLERLSPGVCCVPLPGEIGLLLDAGVCRADAFAPFLLENHMAAGVSREFSDCALLLSAWSQSRFALQTGLGTTPPRPLCPFDDCALLYLLRHGTGSFLPEQIAHPGLLLLLRRDRERGTSYYATLRAYFDCQYNAAAAAKSLYIHRSSFINRMERVQELIGWNQQDPDERLYMMISFRILGDER